MKFILISLLLMLSESKAQSFEGLIHYTVEKKNPNPAFMSEEEFKKKNPDLKSHLELFYFKKDRYKWINGPHIDVLEPVTKRIYSYWKGSDTALWNDANFAVEAATEVKKTNEKDTVLGIPCEVITVKTKWGKTIFYYNASKLSIDSAWFTYHKFNHLSDLFAITGCLPLKIVYKTGFDCLVYTAQKIEPKSLEEKEFSIPSFRYPIKNHHQ